LQTPPPAFAADTYTGYAGVGDYARSNGDPLAVVEAGHKLRDSATNFPQLEPAEIGLYQGTTSVVPIACEEIWASAPAVL
jgi:hypothetical protein